MKKVSKKLNLYVMTEKGLEVVKQLVLFSERITFFVIIGSDHNVKNDFSKDIIEICKKNDISYGMRNKAEIGKSDFSIAVGWRWLIKENEPLIVFHDSLLPKYRGFNPLVSALINSERFVGITALLASEKFDEGDIIQQESLEIAYPNKIAEVIKSISFLYSKIFCDIMESILNNTLFFTPQDESLATYSVWRDDDDYDLDWSQDCEVIKRTIDAMGFPYMNSRTLLNGQECRLTDSEVFDGIKMENNYPGKVIFIDKGKPVVLCGKGALKIISGFYENDNTDILPLDKFRSRFG